MNNDLCPSYHDLIDISHDTIIRVDVFQPALFRDKPRRFKNACEPY